MSDPRSPEPGAFEREWRRRFELFARGATTEHQVSGWSEAGLRRRLAAFDRLLGTIGARGGLIVLDLGTGPGTYVRRLAASGHRAIGVDYSLPSLQRAVAADEGRLGRYAAGDAYSLPFPDHSFDLVVMIGIVQALSEPVRALTEARRILRPGGYLILEILNADEVFHRARRLLDRARSREEGVRSYRRPQALRWLGTCGYRPEKVLPIFLPPRRFPLLESLMDHRVCRWILRVVPGLEPAGAAAFLILSRLEAPAEGKGPRS